MKTLVSIAAVLALSCTATLALAKLPAPSDEAKAKAAEGAAKSAHAGKVGAYQLCKSMDLTAATYFANAKKAGQATKPPAAMPACADPGPMAAAAPAAAAPAKK